MKILIVDDSLLDRRLLMKCISIVGIDCEILEASDGEQGIEVLGNNYKDIGIILLDRQMPKMGGIEFMQAVVKVPIIKDIPIIMITASVSEEDKKIARDANPGLAGYVTKPYKSDKLAELIKALIKKEDTENE
ncbi:MAG: response regulator [Candidatus Zapsychrus exili]|nr:response regulator [Candidatus Zapsychrus exili]